MAAKFGERDFGQNRFFVSTYHASPTAIHLDKNGKEIKTVDVLIDFSAKMPFTDCLRGASYIVCKKDISKKVAARLNDIGAARGRNAMLEAVAYLENHCWDRWGHFSTCLQGQAHSYVDYYGGTVVYALNGGAKLKRIDFNKCLHLIVDVEKTTVEEAIKQLERAANSL